MRWIVSWLFSGLLLACAADPVLPVGSGQVAAVWILDARWIVVVMDQREAVNAELDRLAGPTHAEYAERWRATRDGGDPNWYARHQLLLAWTQWGAEARRAAGEFELTKPAGWALDGNGRTVVPARTTQAVVPVDAGDLAAGAGVTRIGVCVYLGFAEPMRDGVAYTLTGPGGSATWTWSDNTCLSRAIKINQVGYRPGDPGKFGYLGGWLPGLGALPIADSLVFTLVDEATGTAVFQGPAKLRDQVSGKPPKPGEAPSPRARLMTGESVYECDFSAWDVPGTYHLHVPGIGRSWSFRIAADVYATAFYTAVRGLFHQRASCALIQPYTAWTRPRLHTEPVYEAQNLPFSYGPLGAPPGYERFDVIAVTTDLSRATPEVVGGWYDAADWDRNLCHYTVIFDLLGLFELRPGVFSDGQLNLPESGNGIPDLLDEIEFGLRVWLRSQDAAGGVSGQVETSTHTSADDTEHPWTFSQRTRGSTLNFVAAAAWYARLVKPYSPTLAATYAEAARRGWAWSEDLQRTTSYTVNAAHDRGRGAAYTLTWREGDEQVRPWRVAAATQIGLHDADAGLIRLAIAAVETCPPPFRAPFGYRDASPWLYWPLLRQTLVPLDRPLRTTIESWYLDPARELVAYPSRMPYRATWPAYQDYWMGWGSTTMTNFVRPLMLARELRDQPSCLKGILADAAWAFGANPLGMSFTTGIGEVYPVVLQHAWSERDGIADPMPGITIYGITDAVAPALSDVWSAPDHRGVPVVFDVAPRPIWRTYAAHPHINTPQCEFTVHETMSSTILTCGYLMPAGWLPPAELLHRVPRAREQLHGYWLLP